MIRTFISDEQGQTATEYMLLISVIVVAVIAAAYTFLPAFSDGVIELRETVNDILTTGMIDNQGQKR